MGALRGSISYARLFVQGELPASLHGPFIKAIRLRAFQPLDASDDAEERGGWCAVGEPFDLELDHGKVFYNEYLNLGMRLDKWAIPKPIFKAELAEAARVHLEKRGRDKLSRREKDELKVFVARRLRKQVLPTTRVFDLSWNLNTGVVRFWSRAERNVDRLVELFGTTFKLELVPESPYTTATRLPLSSGQAEKLDELQPTEFVPGEP